MRKVLSRVRAKVAGPITACSSIVVEIVYPKTCAGCGSRGHWVCAYCDASVQALGDRTCVRCGTVPTDRGECTCDHLSKDVERARSVYVFDDWPRKLVHQVKYDPQPARIPAMAERMASYIDQFGEVDALVPVPLHRTRLQERGFNQSEDLAIALSRICGVPVQPMLQRTRRTAPQMSLTAADRVRNVRGAFDLAPEWTPKAGHRYLLVDDVRTTGSTLNACAEVLRATPGVLVGVITFAVAM